MSIGQWQNFGSFIRKKKEKEVLVSATKVETAPIATSPRAGNDAGPRRDGESQM